ncbi:DNA repair protein RadA/Sms [Desulfofundulus australicus DSM 11792]|uniref:DNA repair protein RadA n=1 Tax=Desulfofundulus australicus DSM 11792 TaxID=1121425 RepID=A0A1M4ZUG8_9FIRM|nr:DNA repair protein RadA [Desulfofundulus australicus]SHF21693.1 DNA repair protein RadA/Sms [Desulfofundulus australicus DSM 11792]
MSGKTRYCCQECGHCTHSWLGRCPECGAWNSLLEERASGRGQKEGRAAAPVPLPITQINLDKEERFSTGIGELDRVLGGGVVPASLILLGGDPGIGKSTLLLQVATGVAGAGRVVLYVTGEESLQQVRMRAIRLGVESSRLYLLAETDIDAVENSIRSLNPALVVVDSIQTMHHVDFGSAPGSVGQVRECTTRLMRLAKEMGVAIFLVGHVTKEGILAGPRILEHMVDVVLYFEGERHQSFRILRGVKNRFGSTNEIGVFEMKDAGLVEVANPSSLFIMQHSAGPVAGSVVVPTLEGTRPLLVEVQALVSPTGFGTPRRMTAGVDYNRVILIMAVLEKRVGLHLGSYDAYVNAVGGVRLVEPAVDLAIAVALASSFRDRPVNCRLAVVGEVGLTGELRPVTGIEKRVQEAAQLGFTRCLLPRANAGQVDRSRLGTLEIWTARTLSEALEIALENEG